MIEYISGQSFETVARNSDTAFSEWLCKSDNNELLAVLVNHIVCVEYVMVDFVEQRIQLTLDELFFFSLYFIHFHHLACL
jgi:hypothetical protein